MNKAVVPALALLAAFASPALAQVPPGGSSLTLTDGSNTVTGTTKITVSGGTVGGTSPNATLTVTGGSGTVTSVGQTFTGGIVSVSGSPITGAGTLALTVAGTSGGIPYFSSASGWASSAALTANALMIGGGAGAAPSTTTTGTGVLTALGLAVNGSGAISLTTSPAFTTPSLGVATGTSLALGGATIGTDALGVTGTSTFNGNLTVASASLILSGAQSAAAWTTNGIRLKGVAATMTDTSSSGTVATAYTDVLGGNTIAASSATTYTNYYALYSKAPVAGTNVTFTNKWAFGADSAFITGAGSAAAPSLSVGNATTGLYSVSTTGFGIAVNGVNKLDYGITSSGNWATNNTTISVGNGYFVTATGSLHGYGFGNLATGINILLQEPGTAAPYIRSSTDNLTISGGLAANFFLVGGSLPTLTSGSCSGSSAAGGSTAGTFSAATCVAGTYVLSALPTALTGYACQATDRTTTADTLTQTASTTTSATLSGTTAASDVIQFQCLAF